MAVTVCFPQPLEEYVTVDLKPVTGRRGPGLVGQLRACVGTRTDGGMSRFFGDGIRTSEP
jgi:hypothetical protein